MTDHAPWLPPGFDTSSVVVDGARPVSLFIDLGDPTAAVAQGDWIASEAGSRYLVLSARKVRSRLHAQRNRWRMTCGRLPKHTLPADGSRVWWMTWYPRKKRTR